MNSSADAPRFTILYFAALREQAGQEQEIHHSLAANQAELYAELAAAHGFTLPQSRLRAAVNHRFCPWTHPLNPGDTVAFIPPIAGG